MPCRQQKQAKESFKFCTHNHLPEAKNNQKLNLQTSKADIISHY